MVDIDTFLTTLYVMVEDFCKARLPQRRRPGPVASLSQGEVVTLVIFSQWTRFESERSFYRYANQHLRAAFPTLPVRAHFNRLLRHHRDAVAAFSLYVDLATPLCYGRTTGGAWRQSDGCDRSIRVWQGQRASRICVCLKYVMRWAHNERR